MITLYGSGQSRSFRALWALEEAGIPYKYKSVKIGGNTDNGTQTESYKKLNIQGKVPTLSDNGLVLSESGAIVNYIAAQNPQAKLIPTDIVTRAKYDQLCFFVLSELEQPLWTYSKHRFILPKEYRLKEISNTVHWEFEKTVSALEYQLADKEFAVTEFFTMADILIAHTLSWADKAKFNIPDSLLDYTHRMCGRVAFVKALSKSETIF